MPPPLVVYSSSPSKVPASVHVPVGKVIEHCPPDPPLIKVAVIVLVITVDPTLRMRSLTTPLDKLTASHVVLSSASSVKPDAAALLSFNVKFNCGRVSPTTNFNVSEYALNYLLLYTRYALNGKWIVIV